MTAHEVMQEITKTKKWYLPHYKQQTASMIVKRFYAGTLGHETLIKLFNTYGYTLESRWIKGK